MKDSSEGFSLFLRLFYKRIEDEFDWFDALKEPRVSSDIATAEQTSGSSSPTPPSPPTYPSDPWEGSY